MQAKYEAQLQEEARKLDQLTQSHTQLQEEHTDTSEKLKKLQVGWLLKRLHGCAGTSLLARTLNNEMGLHCSWLRLQVGVLCEPS